MRDKLDQQVNVRISRAVKDKLDNTTVGTPWSPLSRNATVDRALRWFFDFAGERSAAKLLYADLLDAWLAAARERDRLAGVPEGATLIATNEQHTAFLGRINRLLTLDISVPE